MIPFLHRDEQVSYLVLDEAVCVCQPLAALVC